MVKKKEEKVGNDVQQPPRQTGNSIQEKFQDAVHVAKMRTEPESQYNIAICVYLGMLRRFGMSLLLSWICLNAFAQLPHPNDTLDNGKKVPFNQFLGRFSVFNELGGAGLYYSLNMSYSLIKSNLVILDLTLGANRIPHGRKEWRKEEWDSYHFPVGLSLFLGRRRSRFNTRIGYSPRIYPSWFGSDRGHYPNCAGICPTPPQHSFFLSLGYVFQHQHGFFTSINAYGIMTLPFPKGARRFGNDPYFMPSAGLTVGYRIPSKQLRKQWTERSFKRRVLRLEKPTKKVGSTSDIDDVFYNDAPLEVDSLEMLEIEAQLAKLKKRHDRFLREEQRKNGRSHVYAEGFGAAGIWSVNYTYTHPIAKSNTWMMEYRGGLGTDNSFLSLPFHVGVKAMKNYRGSGVFLGVQPTIDWKDGTLGAVYYLEHNVEFHFAYGFTGGVAFYLFYDPNKIKHFQEFAPYGGLFFGYRLPQMKKS